jgi:hypothetical protein
MADLTNSTFDNTDSICGFNPGSTIIAKIVSVCNHNTIWVSYYNAQFGKIVKEQIRIANISDVPNELEGERPEYRCIRLHIANLVSREIFNFEGEIVRLNILALSQDGITKAEVLIPHGNAGIAKMQYRYEIANSYRTTEEGIYLDISTFMNRTHQSCMYGTPSDSDNEE